MLIQTPRHARRKDAIRVVDICNLSSSANAFLKRRVLAMRAQGIDNRIICIDGPYVRRLEEAGIPVKTVHLTRGFDLVRVAISFLEILTYLRKEKIDLVHTHFSVPGFIGRLAAWVGRVPAIVHTIHGFPFHDKSPRLQRWFYIWLERLVGPIADVVLSQNRANFDEALKLGIVPQERLRFIGNGIALDRFQPIRRGRPADGCVTIACVARMEKIKNHGMLFEAVRLLKERGLRFRVWLVGEGELRSAHEQLCARLGITDVVHFLGYRDDVPELLAHADIAVLTSLKEGVPRAVLEAMGVGIPAVATRIPGSVDAIREGETGFTVKVDDSRALADRLSQLIGDELLRARMGDRGREVVEQEFDENAIIESLTHIYRRILLDKGIVARPTVPQAVST